MATEKASASEARQLINELLDMHNRAEAYLAKFQRAERIRQQRAQKAAERRLRLQRAFNSAKSVDNNDVNTSHYGSISPTPACMGLAHPFGVGSRNHPLRVKVTPEPVKNRRPENKTELTQQEVELFNVLRDSYITLIQKLLRTLLFKDSLFDALEKEDSKKGPTDANDLAARRKSAIRKNKLQAEQQAREQELKRVDS